MQHLLSTDALISFIILVVLEIVLGIDNVIFVSIIINRMESKDMSKARRFWMFTGMIVRSMLLLGLGWLLAQKGKYLFSLLGKGFDLASIVMLAGGLFLIYKSVREIHSKLEGEDPDEEQKNKKVLGLAQGLTQIVVIDAVFSFDSIITAGGTAKYVEVMIAAVIIAMIIMFLFSPKISGFIHQHPTLKILALSFLVMIGLSLVIEGWDAASAETLHLKNYIYFGMAFSCLVELLNLTILKRQKRHRIVKLNEPKLDKEDTHQRSDQAK